MQISGSEDETLQLWDLRCSSAQSQSQSQSQSHVNRLVHSMPAHEESVTSVGFHPTGQRHSYRAEAADTATTANAPAHAAASIARP